MGKLYIVPTPIGNLEDITLRAVRVLKEADVVLAEDTRTTAVLLKHLGIEKRMFAHHKFNEHAAVESVAARIESGETIALVSDAGTPGISDPGFLLVRTCIAHGVEVETLPGATAFCSCTDTERVPGRPFLFRGIPSAEEGAKQTIGTTERGDAYHNILRIALPGSENIGTARSAVWAGTARIGLPRIDQKVRGNGQGKAGRSGCPFQGARTERGIRHRSCRPAGHTGRGR